MFTNTQSAWTFRLLTILLAIATLLSACTPTVQTTTLPEVTSTSIPPMPLEPTATTVQVATAVPTSDNTMQISLDSTGIASRFVTEIIPAVPASDNTSYWEVLPEYTAVTLRGYPISSSGIEPQLFIFPVKDLGEINEGAGQVVASLQTLLQSPQEIPAMPFLPLMNEVQMMHGQIQYLDFKSGQGLRYVTEFSQGIVPVTNSRLVYTYQGLTSDGKYYVAAVLPINHPSLPVDEHATDNIPLEFNTDYKGYLSNVTNNLNTAAPDSFTPALTQLDAMLSSIEIR